MKNFVEYLNESTKTYDFKIGIAGEVPEGCKDQMELALKKYGLTKITNGKRTPIAKRPLDFPQLENIEVTYFEAEVSYPTTPQIMQEYIGQSCGIDQSHIIVRDPQAPQEDYQKEANDSAYETMIGSDIKDPVDANTAQKDVGENRVMDLLKELEQARKERNHDPVNGIGS